MTTQRAERSPFYTFARIVMGIVFALIYPVRAHNKERMDRDAPFIIVSSHSSMLDPMAIAVKCKRHEIRFLGKKELTQHPVVRWVVNHLHMITLDRHATDIGAIRAALDVLKQGHVVGIFPEGGRRKPENAMKDLENGVSLLTLRAKVPLIPVHFRGPFKPFRTVHMYVGEPIAYGDLLESGINRATCDALTDRIAQTMLSLGSENVENT